VLLPAQDFNHQLRTEFRNPNPGLGLSIPEQATGLPRHGLPHRPCCDITGHTTNVWNELWIGRGSLNLEGDAIAVPASRPLSESSTLQVSQHLEIECSSRADCAGAGKVANRGNRYINSV
jgi:hypothetical protein